MPGRPQKPSSSLRRPSRRVSPAATVLPASGRKGPIPALGRRPGGAWHKATREWWETVWRSPMATQFLDVHVFGLRMLARLVDEVHHGRAKTSTYSEIRHWQDNFGLSPDGMRRLEWTIGEGGQLVEFRLAPTGVTRLAAV